MSDDSADPGPAGAELASLARRLGYTFRDGALLHQALCHRSWCAENGGRDSNERLEFLGDAVLGLAVTDHTFGEYPDLPEGAMAKVRAAVVSSVSLAELAAELGLGDHLLLGRGEEATGGRSKPSILADALEAVIGACYLDGGWTAAAAMVVGLVRDRVRAAVDGPGVRDYKTRLQELLARRMEDAPVYALTERGPDHDKWFTATVLVSGVAYGRGEGRSKKIAQQAAAEDAWHRLSTMTQGPDGAPTSVGATDGGAHIAVAPAVNDGRDAVGTAVDGAHIAVATVNDGRDAVGTDGTVAPGAQIAEEPGMADRA